MLENKEKNIFESGKAFEIFDPHTEPDVITKSKTSFLSIVTQTGQVTISSYFGRKVGLMDGSRIQFLEHPDNPLIWVFWITKTVNKSIEIKVRKGTYTFNNLKIVEKLGESFEFNKQHTGRIRLYINEAVTIPISIKDESGSVRKHNAYQIYDIPSLRTDLREIAKMEYCNRMLNKKYIIEK